MHFQVRQEYLQQQLLRPLQRKHEPQLHPGFLLPQLINATFPSSLPMDTLPIIRGYYNFEDSIR